MGFRTYNQNIEGLYFFVISYIQSIIKSWLNFLWMILNNTTKFKKQKYCKNC